MRLPVVFAISILAISADRAFAQSGSAGCEGATADACAQAAAQAPPPTTASRIALGPQGFLEFHGLLQAWSLNSFDPRNPYVSRETAQSTFLIRRSEFKVAGQIRPEVTFEMMIDPSRVLEFGSKNINIIYPLDGPEQPIAQVPVQQPVSSVAILRDAFVTFKFIPYANISIGQGHTPISYEGLTSSSSLLFVERADISRIFGDQRDLGMWLDYRFARVSYVMGIFNGAGADAVDTTRYQDFAGRIEFSPGARVQIGGSVLRTMSGDGSGVRTIAGADMAFRGSRLTAQSEFYWNQSFANDAAAAETRRRGSYASAAYLVGHWVGDWQIAGRIDRFDPAERLPGADFTRLTGGVNILLDGHRAKLQINYTRTFGPITNPAPGVGFGSKNNLLLINAQVAF